MSVTPETFQSFILVTILKDPHPLNILDKSVTPVKSSAACDKM
jgi:hypothetical protein